MKLLCTSAESFLFPAALPSEEALTLLRAIRSEARGVPNLLTATQPQTSDGQEDIYQESPQGYYDDGAYVAASFSSLPPHEVADTDGDIDPQEAYYTSLLNQFHALSSALRSLGPIHPPSHSTVTTANILSSAPAKKWRTTLLYTQPTTSLLSKLSQESVIKGVAALEKFFDWKMLERGKYVGAWAWGLLARCREVGMMGSEEVGVLRDLSKKSRGMIRELSAGIGQGIEEEENEEGSEVEDEVEGDGDDDGQGCGVTAAVDSVGEGGPVAGYGKTSRLGPEAHEDGFTDGGKSTADGLPAFRADDMVTARQRLIATLQEGDSSDTSVPSIGERGAVGKLSSSDPQPGQLESGPSLFPEQSEQTDTQAHDGTATGEATPNTNRIVATLDMIITIIGEEYGQKDLLDGRMVWD